MACFRLNTVKVKRVIRRIGKTRGRCLLFAQKLIRIGVKSALDSWEMGKAKKVGQVPVL